MLSHAASDTVADIAVLGRIASGDTAAVAELYDRHASLLYGLIRRIVRDATDADDVLQEVFVRVWQRADTYDPALGSPTAWLVRIARNRAIDRLRANGGRACECEAKEALPATGRVSNPEAYALAAEERAAVLRALEHLSEDQRRLIQHAYFLGYTQSELAAHFGLPLGTVKTRVRTAMITLREQLQCLNERI